MTDTVPARAPVTLFTTSWCGPCARLKLRLTERGIAFVEVDVEADEAAAAVLLSINGGHLTVPTVQFGDGSALTNPSVEAVAERIELLGQLETPGTTTHS